jgi:tagaturonate epimerase
MAVAGDMTAVCGKEYPSQGKVNPFHFGSKLAIISPVSLKIPDISMKIQKYTIGMGDRFAHQGRAQLSAVVQARELGIEINPVWNKSNREHTIVKSKPDDLRAEADAAVTSLGWKDAYYVDADHIGLKTVDWFIAGSDFYTLDVADFTGKAADDAGIGNFVKTMEKYTGALSIPGIAHPFDLTEAAVRAAARKFLFAMQEAGRIYRHVAEKKGAENFVTEVSVDETDTPQTPVELILILAMIAQQGIPAQTIAPKFTGRFNKGVDYVGDLAQFEKEFDEDLCVIAFAIREFGLPETLKLSVHSGSDKFSLYPAINRLIKKHGAGLHVKTAGTTWLEEVIGLAEAGGEGLQIAKDVYAGAFARFDELTAPYATVIDIDKPKLPDPAEVAGWDSAKYTNTLRHVQSCADYNLHFRQLIHVGFKKAAEMGARYTDALKANEEIIGHNVTQNLFERHIKPIFG